MFTLLTVIYRSLILLYIKSLFQFQKFDSSALIVRRNYYGTVNGN